MIFNLHRPLVKKRPPLFQFLVEVSDYGGGEAQYQIDISQLSWQSGASGIIDWGDGSRDSQNAHVYTSAGIYKISLIGCLHLLSLSEVKPLIRLLSPLPKEIVNSTTGWPVSSYGFLKNCGNLQAVPENLFDNVPNLKSIYEFFEWSGISEIPEGLFRKLNQLENCCYAFCGCGKLTSIPAGLFDNNPNITDLRGCFCDCWNLTGEAPELWKMFPSALHENCFENCIHLSNYNSIPSGWK